MMSRVLSPSHNWLGPCHRPRANVQVIDPMTTLCGDTWCAWNRLRDANHLSHAGSVVVARALAEQGAALKAP